MHPKGSRNRRRTNSRVGQLNLTSMIDVIFLLLIYFVVTANFSADEGVLTAALPQGTGLPRPVATLPPQKIRIQLTVGADNQVLIERGTQRYPSFTALREDLDALIHDPDNGRAGGLYRPNNPILIAAGPTVRWQHVVNAFNACLAARYTNIAFERPKA